MTCPGPSLLSRPPSKPIQSDAISTRIAPGYKESHMGSQTLHMTWNRRRFMQHHMRKGTCWTPQALETLHLSLQQFCGKAGGIGAFLESAPPPCYLIYLLAAGVGLPCSEDALVAWVGSNISKGMYKTASMNVWVLGIVYFGVVTSDMITFGVGVLLKWGFFRQLRQSLLRDPQKFDKATATIQRWSRHIGVPARQFLAGVALGALGTMPLQLLLGYMLRGSPNPYFAALAIAAGPNLVGHVLGPLATALGFMWSSKQSETGKFKGSDLPPAPS